jgi:hypothetical protein
MKCMYWKRRMHCLSQEVGINVAAVDKNIFDARHNVVMLWESIVQLVV